MPNLFHVAERIRNQIGREIGYVSQQVASAWALNNSKAVAIQITDHQIDEEILGRNIAELFMNSFCVADQYYVDIEGWYKREGLPLEIDSLVKYSFGSSDDLEDLARDIQSATRSTVRTLAHYHGWETGSSRPERLIVLISELHKIIYRICRKRKIDLYGHMVKVIERASNRMPRTSYSERYDPVTSSVLRDFSPIKAHAVCRYGRSANAWGARRYREENSLEANLNDCLDVLSRLSRCANNENVDALVLMLPAQLSSTLESLAKTLNRILWFFGYNDPAGVNSLDNIKNDNWRFKFLGEEFFVQAFGICYDSSSTRYTYGVDATFVQFIAESAFHRSIERSKKSQTEKDIRDYAETLGKPYLKRSHDADAFIHSLRFNDDPVKWFEERG